MGILQALAAILGVVGQIITLFQKTPEEKRADLIKGIEGYMKDLHQAVQKSQESGGDTSALEDLINRRR